MVVDWTPLTAMALAALALVPGAGACNNGERRGQRRSRMVRGEKVTPLSSRFGKEQGFAFVLPQLAPVSGVGGAGASHCGACHEAIYKEWRGSSHAAALSDLQFQAELHKKSSPRWLCLNCHIPVQNQRRHLVKGLRGGNVLRPVLVKNPGFDPAMRSEGITCATCHVRKGPGGESVIVGARGSTRAPHPTRADPKALRTVCLRCHDPKGARITPTLMCWFQTRKELAEGAFSGKRDCVDCHMEAVRRRLAAGFSSLPLRQTRRHHWVGGGVPKRFTGYRTLLARGYRPGLEVTLEEASRASNGGVSFRAALENRRAGHWLPTADPERHLLLLATLLAADGRRLARKRRRIGQVWRWAPRAEKISDNRLEVKQRRSWAGAFGAVEARGAATLELKVWHVRLSSANAAHMRKAPVTEEWVPGLRRLLRRMERHYPMATLVYLERVNLATGHRARASAAELLRLSDAEKNVPLSGRDY